MKNLVAAFPKQLTDAIEIGKNHSFSTPVKAFSQVVVTGLGGSGIGGSIVQNYVFDKLDIPFSVNKDYFLPAYVNGQTLLIVCSYSGNTEETLQAMEQAFSTGATIVCITSGGKISEIAREKGFDCILVPPGMPPRSCLGYSMVQILYVLYHFGLIGKQFENEISASAQQLSERQEAIIVDAKDIAGKMLGKIPVIYSSPAYEGVAVRFRQQINENSKLLAWHAVIPEMNHNELVGWRDEAKDKAVIIFRNSDDYTRVQRRMEINMDVIKNYTDTIIQIESIGISFWERAIYLIHLTDWVSVILAELRGVDATEVRVIDFLKGSLSNF